MLKSSGVARLCYVEVVMGVKMGWIQIKMSHPLAQNGAALAHFVLTKHTLVYQVQKLSSTQGNFCASSCLPIKWHTSHCSTGKNWHEGVAEQLLPFIENKEMKVIVYVDFVKMQHHLLSTFDKQAIRHVLTMVRKCQLMTS